MTSREIDLLCEIDKEISQYNHLSRDQLFTLCVNRHLAASLHVYNDEVNEISKFLIAQADIRVRKALNKIKKFSDKDIIKTYMEDE